MTWLRIEIWGKLWSSTFLSLTQTIPPGKEGVGVVGGRGLCSWSSLTVPHYWLTSGGDSYLYLWEGVQFVIVRLQIKVNVFFFQQQQRGEVEVGQDGWKLKQRLQQDSEHGAYHVVERGESQRVAPRWGTYCVFFVFFETLIVSQATSGRTAKSEIEAPHKSSWKWKVEVEWGSGPCWERSHHSLVVNCIRSWDSITINWIWLSVCFFTSQTCCVHCADRFMSPLVQLHIQSTGFYSPPDSKVYGLMLLYAVL